MNRRKLIKSSGAVAAAFGTVTVAGCVEEEENGEDDEGESGSNGTPAEVTDIPDEEPLAYMSELCNYINGYRDDEPTPSFDVDDLATPYEEVVRTLEQQA